uniref:Polycystin cation channel PKD1/PKD2 domain-containing protein n=1 Tax=Polytomella parva TaxID=51329 RepID=A0A7S0YB92_9CHLO|mmetsp:Transcript_15088/g.26767  ORF Transcript_15088/g.26767 Transcript_15088/m.26767 type:complete len:1673 (+) Transcript_15088:171-5189(+)|eukprot:CAMPEP_0175050760 /NCGR_PEP_ID=MMETSP0052_2-20121109/7431_1 /TAXON_ID=51329 ORGANISM="Polytomella parva, Strain SAG 63-3" /NCGR_SAMPLE_ID=MMETSP0052_2 /ASSEMBLY_ACC=CAM_ASM_000194 /LENGTH=1672 /DNA_ID=CAMNT_0016314985 /DNA_START=71 /DNA_END=5089 /DNA_ORIENTATION=-
MKNIESAEDRSLVKKVETTAAQKVVQELYNRYEKQRQRWRDYRNLFGFFGFVALFLATLYLQRDARTSYGVLSTLSTVLLPSQTNYQSTNDLYNWLSGVVTSVWVDPVCGDGICEVPFEYPSYSSFGCKADCGLLTEALNLSTIQIDLYFDFTHLSGSMSSSDLMSQTSWNLCPQNIAYSSNCYYSSDNTFDRISGEQHDTLSDVPPGQWEFALKRDIFNKVQGAVRDVTLLDASVFYYKVYIAEAAALAEQNFEISLLTNATNITTMDFWSFADQYVRNSNTTYSATNAWSFYRGWAYNATCTCNGISFSSSNVTDVNSVLSYLNATVSPSNINNYANTSFLSPSQNADYTLYQNAYCSASSNLQYTLSNSSDVTSLIAVNSTNQASWCATGLALTQTWRSYFLSVVRSLLIDQRLGDQKTTGKIAKRNAVLSNMQTYLTSNYPELVSPIFSDPTGTNANGDPINCQLSILTQLYVDSYQLQISPQRAALNLTRKYVYSSTVDMINLRQRSVARVAEVDEQIAYVSAAVVPAPWTTYQNYTLANSTVNNVYSAFIAANSSNSTVPDPAAARLDAFSISYNLLYWQGNTTAYLVSDLIDRGPAYVGQCVAIPVSCAATSNSSNPFTCAYLSGSQAPVTGNMSTSSYREDCEIPCNHKLDCNAVCECYGTCDSNTEYCECSTCDNMDSNAAADSQFQSIVSVVQDQASAAAAIASVSSLSGRRLLHQRYRRQLMRELEEEARSGVEGGGGGGGSERSLLQTTTNVTDQLASVVTQIQAVGIQQTAISSQMNTLKSEVDRAQQLAQARANDDRVLNLIAAGQANLQAGQAVIEAKLEEIIGKQNQALSIAQSSQAALTAIENLAQQQLSALQSLEDTVNSQLSSLKTATYQGTITLLQALQLWKTARRNKAVSTKAATLANIPIQSNPEVDYLFTMENVDFVTYNSSRERDIGLTNRLVGGMFLHVTRVNETTCASSKFNNLQNTCTGERSIIPYGVDPVFKMGTQSYNPSLDDPAGLIVTQYYNCSALTNPTYNLTYLNQSVNPAPYCAELYNHQDMPYLYHYFPLAKRKPGFPVWFDINLSADMASSFMTYVQEGLYLDQYVQNFVVQLVTYNAQLKMFGFYEVTFKFTDGGSVLVNNNLFTFRTELYTGSRHDRVRYAMEIILFAFIGLFWVFNLHEMLRMIRKRNFLSYLLSGWNQIEIFSNLILMACAIMWRMYIRYHANSFTMNVRYDVYSSLNTPANMLALNNGGDQLALVNDHINRVKEIVTLLNWYYTLNGISILLLLARILRRMDFQPRLGVVTRSLWLAGPDLIHFGIVAGMVFVGYAMMGHLLFGNAIDDFSSFGDSINCCFQLLLGDIDVNNSLRALGGLQSVAGAIFFWSFELLVFMVLLNFLLAIIVDAFSEVKERTEETVGMHTELFQMFRDQWRSWAGAYGRGGHGVSEAKLGALLKQWSGEKTTEEKKEVDDLRREKLLTILNEDLDEATLIEIFNECLKDAPDMAEKERKRFSLLKFFGGRDVPNADQAEIALAAHYIIDRFGQEAEYDEDLEVAQDGAGGIKAFKERAAERVEAARIAAANAAASSGGEGGGLGGEEKAAMGALGGGEGGGGKGNASLREAALEKERDMLAQALERLAEVQRELAEGQRNLMQGQRQLAEQQSKLVQLINEQPT